MCQDDENGGGVICHIGGELSRQQRIGRDHPVRGNLIRERMQQGREKEKGPRETESFIHWTQGDRLGL